jgi:outer membrane protein, heavy metal efflux system
VFWRKKKQEIILTGAITLVQAQQTDLLRNPDLQAFSYEIRVRKAETLQASLIPNPRLNVRV